MKNAIFGNVGFTIHLIVYVLVNLLLVIINLTVDPDSIWFFWPLLGWGIGITAHGIAAWLKSRSGSPVS